MGYDCSPSVPVVTGRSAPSHMHALSSSSMCRPGPCAGGGTAQPQTVFSLGGPLHWTRRPDPGDSRERCEHLPSPITHASTLVLAVPEEVLHFTDEEMGSEKLVTCPRWHSLEVAEAAFGTQSTLTTKPWSAPQPLLSHTGDRKPNCDVGQLPPSLSTAHLLPVPRTSAVSPRAAAG